MHQQRSHIIIQIKQFILCICSNCVDHQAPPVITIVVPALLSKAIQCGSKDKRMMQYGNWGSKEQQFLLQHIDTPPVLSNSHYVEAQRHHNPDLIPKWKKSNAIKPVGKCRNPKCNEPYQGKLIKPLFATAGELEIMLGVS